ncbi:MAG: hypothetical protein OEL20_12670 [Sulfuritalea sp.]|nr:hypothetical protein [Sulfuritalea sp.]
MDHDPHFRTPEDVRTYIKEDTAEQNALWQEKYEHILRAKNAVWLLLLVVFCLQVYMINVMIEATRLETRAMQNAAGVRLINCRPAGAAGVDAGGTAAPPAGKSI